MKNIIIAVIIVGVIAVGGYFLLSGSYSPRVSPPPVNAPVAPISESQTPRLQTPQTSSLETESENAIVYSDGGYSPNTITVKAGATVIFKNQSSQSMWTASAVHPTHRSYPTTGGCLGSTFDACKGIQPGGSWSFKFDITGTWKYHNHLTPGNTGTIVVE